MKRLWQALYFSLIIVGVFGIAEYGLVQFCEYCSAHYTVHEILVGAIIIAIIAVATCRYSYLRNMDKVKNRTKVITEIQIPSVNDYADDIMRLP